MSRGKDTNLKKCVLVIIFNLSNQKLFKIKQIYCFKPAKINAIIPQKFNKSKITGGFRGFVLMFSDFLDHRLTRRELACLFSSRSLYFS